MHKIGNMFHAPDADDFSEGDHQEYVKGGLREILLDGGAAVVLIGAFVVSLV